VPKVAIPGVRIGEELGRGAYSVVYRGERARQWYAVKVPLRGGARDDALIRSFAREATLLACIDHPNVAKVHAAGTSELLPYLVMDLVAGETLAHRLAAGPLTLAETMRVGLDVASALAEAHQRGLVHQDVKPSNIMIGPDGAATLLDFGLMTRAGPRPADGVIGTVLFSSPEQTGTLHRPVEPRSDLYSLGGVLYACLTGSPPFRAQDAAELLRMHAVERPTPLATIRPEVPPLLGRLVERLLAKDPDDRVQSAGDVVADLLRLAPDDRLPRPRRRPGRPGEPGRLVGRRGELLLTQTAWSWCRAGHRGVVTVRGDAGVGKTSLVRAALRDLSGGDGETPGAPPLVLSGRCAPASPPLALLRDLLASHVRDLDRLPDATRRAGRDRLLAAASGDEAMLVKVHPALAGEPSAVLAGGPADAAEGVAFRAAVVRFLTRLAGAAGGLVIWADDIHWLGPADRRILEDLLADLTPAPLLVVCATRVAPSRLAPGSARSWAVELSGLTDVEVAELIRDYLGEVGDATFVRDVTVRSSGSPLAAVEYVRAVIDAGLIRPDWGRFVLDRASLDSLPLPDEVLDLIRRRADALGPDSAAILGCAAVIGRTFDAWSLIVSGPGPPDQVHAAIAEAETHQLVERSGADRWSFVHDSVREALLSSVGEADRRETHRRLAVALDARRARTDVDVYILARHAELGGLYAPRRYDILVAAAAAALALPAPREAAGYYRAAAQAAAEAGIRPNAEVEEGHALACTRSVQPAEARQHFLRALEGQRQPVRRARLLGRLAWLEFGEYRLPPALRYVRRGLAEINRGMPENPVALTVVSLVRWTVGMLCRWPAVGFGTARGEQRLYMETLRWLYSTGGACEYLSFRPAHMLPYEMAGVYPSQRLGYGAMYLRGHGHLAILAAQLGRRRKVERSATWLCEQAERTGDPALIALIALFAATARNTVGGSAQAARDHHDLIRSQARWMDASTYQGGHIFVVHNLAERGYFRQAWETLEAQAKESGEYRPMPELAIVRARLAHALGLPPTAHPGLASVFAQPPDEVGLRYLICRDLVEFEVEDGELGADFEAVVVAGERLGVHPLRVPRPMRAFWPVVARARVEQARAVPVGPRRDERLRTAAAAIRRARWAGQYPVFGAELRALRAAWQTLAGRPGRALRALERAERSALELDAPRIRCDVLVERARCLLSLGRDEEARGEADLAASLAARIGWVARDRAIIREFGPSEDHQPPPSTGGVPMTTSSIRDRARLDAVLQVSAAAGMRTEPRAVATVVLDEIIKILRADRALLMLPERDDDGAGRPSALTVYAGRSADQDAEPVALSGYATTIVERVRAEDRALIVTGTDEGAALGSESAVQHGLRSILAAPVPMEGRGSGVIYVDSRVSTGLFTGDDVEILVALAKQVGLSVRLAEAASLQAMVAAERRERELAEALRDVTERATATLDTQAIPGQVLLAARPVLPFDAAWVLTRRGSEPVRVGSAHGDANRGAAGDPARDPTDDVVGREFDPAPGSTLARLFSAGGAHTGAQPDGGPFPGGPHPYASWLAVPAELRPDTGTVVVLASRPDGVYGEQQVQLARTVLEHAVIAYQNARLFEEVQRHAMTDQLTGLANRRHFEELARAAVRNGAAEHRPTSVLMIDIDHFKRVNDAHGHLVGDDVLAEIARRIKLSLRPGDIAGRVGGEEFAAVLPATISTARSIAERLRQAIAGTPVPTSAGLLEVRTSVGLTALARPNESLRDLLDRADQALYQAKRDGRDRVVVG
jgi:diguanylate cyclase (GGDEF)-like protein